MMYSSRVPPHEDRIVCYSSVEGFSLLSLHPRLCTMVVFNHGGEECFSNTLYKTIYQQDAVLRNKLQWRKSLLWEFMNWRFHFSSKNKKVDFPSPTYLWPAICQGLSFPLLCDLDKAQPTYLQLAICQGLYFPLLRNLDKVQPSNQVVCPKGYFFPLMMIQRSLIMVGKSVMTIWGYPIKDNLRG